MKKLFEHWLKENYIRKDCQAGDLAKDVDIDSKFPKSNSLKILIEHLETARACPEAISTLKECHAEFKIITLLEKFPVDIALNILYESERLIKERERDTMDKLKGCVK
jgi:uncharacterized protein YozE (UPF0346 family)